MITSVKYRMEGVQIRAGILMAATSVHVEPASSSVPIATPVLVRNAMSFMNIPQNIKKCMFHGKYLSLYHLPKAHLYIDIQGTLRKS